MASGYEKMECGVTDPNLGWGGGKPTPIADAVLTVIAFAFGGLTIWAQIDMAAKAIAWLIN